MGCPAGLGKGQLQGHPSRGQTGESSVSRKREYTFFKKYLCWARSRVVVSPRVCTGRGNVCTVGRSRRRSAGVVGVVFGPGFLLGGAISVLREGVVGGHRGSSGWSSAPGFVLGGAIFCTAGRSRRRSSGVVGPRSFLASSPEDSSN